MEQWYGNEGFLGLYHNNVRTVQFRGGEQTAPSYIDTGNNFGLGTKTPGAKLEVITTSTTAPAGYFYINTIHTGYDSNSAVSIFSDHVSATGQVLRVRGDGSGNLLTLNQGGTDRLVVQADGQVGIGTTGPSTPLHVWSTSWPQFRVSYNSSLYFTLDHAATLNVYGNDWYVRLNSSEKFRIKQDGKIGIGTNNPLSLLTLHQAAGANIRFSNPTTGRYFIVGEGVGAPDKFSFRGNSYRSTDTLTVDFANNRVGVNNIAPATTLDVTGVTTARDYIALGASAINGSLTWLTSSPARLILFGASGRKLSLGSNGAYDKVTLDLNGNVGIGITNPSEKLVVVGNITMSGSATHVLKSTGDLHIYADNAKVIEMWTSGSDYMFKSYHDDIRYPDIGTKGMVLGTNVAPESILQLYSEAANGDTTLRIDHGNSARGDFYLRSDNYSSTGNRFIIGEVTGGDMLTIMSDNNGSGGGAGYVGIGTVTPNFPLNIHGSGTDLRSLVLKNNNVTVGDKLKIGFDVAWHSPTQIGSYIGAEAINVSPGQRKEDLIFGNLDQASGGREQERVRIQYDGNVGIGTTAPDATLDVRRISAAASEWTAAFCSDNQTLAIARAHDSVLIQASDVPCLKIYEAASTPQVATLAVGDGNATLASSNTLRFYVNGSNTGDGYNGLGGTRALLLNSAGAATFVGSVTATSGSFSSSMSVTNSLSIGTSNGGYYAGMKANVDSDHPFELWVQGGTILSYGDNTADNAGVVFLNAWKASGTNRGVGLQQAGTTLLYCNGLTGGTEISGALTIGSYTLPTADGTNGYVLKTNGSGTVAWAADSGGGGTVTSVTTPADSGLDISEASPAPSITLDLAELTDMTTDIGSTDEVILLDTGSGGGQRRKAFGELKLSQFNNDSGWTDSTVTSVTTPADSGITIANTTTTPSITLDFSEFTDWTSDIIGAYEVIFIDTGSGGGQRRKAFSELKLSKFNNDSGWTSNAGTVTSITAGDGLSGGAISSSGTIANTDKGTSQNIFKSMQAKNSAGTTIGTCAADTNSDTFILKELGNGVNLTVDSNADTITIGLDTVLGLFTRLDMDQTDTRQKIRLYGTSDNFCLGFNSGYTFGGLGGDGTANPAFVLTAQNSNTAGRGFWWGDAGHSDAQGAMAVSVDGRLTVATAVRVGFGESDTVEPGSSSSTSELNVNGTIEATAYLGLDWEDLPNISTLDALPA